MTDDELQRAYAALRRQRERQPASERPDAEQLASAVDGDAPTSERTAVLLRALESGAAKELAILQAATSAADHTMAPKRDAPMRWTTGLLPLAAAAALLVIVGVPVSREWLGFSTARDAPRFRGDSGSATAPLLIAPAESAGSRQFNTPFTWASVPRADSYRLELIDTEGAVVASFTTTDTTLLIADSVDRVSASRATSWWVIATLGSGDQLRSAVRRLARDR